MREYLKYRTLKNVEDFELFSCHICKKDKPSKEFRESSIRYSQYKCRECATKRDKAAREKGRIARGKLKRYKLDLVGKIFGHLTVIQRHSATTKYVRWLCRCVCGKEIVLVAGNIVGGTKSCGCIGNRKGPESPDWTGCGELSGSFFSRMKKAAKKRDIPFDVTIEYLWNLFLAQNRKCSLSGVILNMPRNSSDLALSRQTASVDRIDSSKGYIVGNLQWVHKDLNYMKRAYSQDDFIDLCKSVVNFQESKIQCAF